MPTGVQGVDDVRALCALSRNLVELCDLLRIQGSEAQGGLDETIESTLAIMRNLARRIRQDAHHAPVAHSSPWILP